MNQLALMPRRSKADARKLLKRIKVLFNRDRLDAAKPLCEELYALGVRSPEFLHIYGLTLRACGDLDGALVKIHAAHEEKPDNAGIINSLGLVFLDLKDTEAAITMFKRATSKNEKFDKAWFNLGNALRVAERYKAAEIAYKCAYHLDRSKTEPLLNIAIMLTDLRKYDRAAELMDDILRNHENISDGMKLRRLQIAMRLEDLDYIKEHKDLITRESLNEEELDKLDSVRAQYHSVYDQFDEAIAILEEAVARRGSNQADLISHLGLCYSLAGRVDEGIATHNRLLEEFPDHVTGRYNLSFLQFKKGQIEEAFENYETRWHVRTFPSKRRKFDAPMWRGEDIQGQNVLVWREQGIGDEIRFASLLPELHERGCSITFECAGKLMPIWKTSFPWARVRPEGEDLCISDPDYAEFDYQVPIGSLGAVFRNSIAAFDANQKPWIVRNAEVEFKIRQQLGIRSDELLVGVCWRSINQVASRDKVFLNCAQLAAFKDLPGVRWLNLQYSSTDEEIEVIRNGGLNIHHYVDVDQKDDLIGARNLVGACDLVISVGGSVGDLAGGVGTPMIYMTREMSEAFLGTDRVPWFVNCKSYPIAAYRSDDTIARIVADWGSIADWVEELKPEDRKCDAAGVALPVPLDLEYPVVREGE